MLDIHLDGLDRAYMRIARGRGRAMRPDGVEPIGALRYRADGDGSA